MNKTLCIILEDQLFEYHPALKTDADFLIVEDIDRAKKRNYHKFKLAYQFTAMREYAEFLTGKNQKVWYYNIENHTTYEAKIRELVEGYKYKTVAICEPNYEYSKNFNIEKIASDLGIFAEILHNPMFLTQKAEFSTFLSTKKSKQLVMRDFYSWQRARLGILVVDGKPVGGKWSFDEDNRQKLPKTTAIKSRQTEFESDHFSQVSLQIQTLFPDNPGKLDTLWLPVNYSEVLKTLEDFFEQHLHDFGTYEDALTTRDPFVFHAVISPMINYGLLTPQLVLERLDQYLIKNFTFSLYNNHLSDKIEHFRYASVEGFVRQIIGWREWVKGMYDTQYDLNNLKKYNHFSSSKPLPNYFWDPSLSDLKENIPLQLALQKTHDYAWNHHIERLMIIANWMTINEYDPLACLDWFSEMYVDAFDWVMVPNVLGMGLFADGGIYATKPYVAGGNYIKKMSDYPGSKNWEKLWTDKFWLFLEKHEAYFSTNYRLNMLLKARKNRTS